MPYDYVNQNWSLTPLLEKLVAEKKAGLKLQERKHQDWTDNYELYRNKVKTNRLTQRQAVNIPLMKETIKTQLSVIDDPPIVDWKELSGDEEKELIFQEAWNQMVKDNNMDLVDVLDKKNVYEVHVVVLDHLIPDLLEDKLLLFVAGQFLPINDGGVVNDRELGLNRFLHQRDVYRLTLGQSISLHLVAIQFVIVRPILMLPFLQL